MVVITWNCTGGVFLLPTSTLLMCTSSWCALQLALLWCWCSWCGGDGGGGVVVYMCMYGILILPVGISEVQ